jgi:hypothetical protein
VSRRHRVPAPSPSARRAAIETLTGYLDVSSTSPWIGDELLAHRTLEGGRREIVALDARLALR